MAAVAIVRLEGVLAGSPDLPFAEREAVADGVRLVASLLGQWRVVIVHEQEPSLANHWLATRATGIARAMTSLLPSEQAFTYGHPDLWLTTDPEEAATALDAGVNALLVARPAYVRGDMKPGGEGGMAPWDALVTEMERQQAMLVADARRQRQED